MANGPLTIIVYVVLTLIAILFIYLGLKFGEYIAKRHEKQKFDFKEELDKIVKNWKKSRGQSD